MKKIPTALCVIPIPFMASLIDGFNSLYILVTGILLLILIIKVIYHLFKHQNIKEKISRNYFIFCILSVVYSLIYMFIAIDFIGNYYFQYLILVLFVLFILVFTYKTIHRYTIIILVVFFIATLAISAISYWQVQKRLNSQSNNSYPLDSGSKLPNLRGCREPSIF